MVDPAVREPGDTDFATVTPQVVGSCTVPVAGPVNTGVLAHVPETLSVAVEVVSAVRTCVMVPDDSDVAPVGVAAMLTGDGAGVLESVVGAYEVNVTTSELS